MTLLQKMIFLGAVLIAFLVFDGNADEGADKDQDILSMKDLKKKCLVLASLGKSYGVTSGFSESQKRNRRSSYYDEDEDEDDEDEDEKRQVSSGTRFDGTPESNFKRITERPVNVGSLNALESGHLKELATTCQKIIKMIDTYQLESLKFAGQWNTFVQTANSQMRNLRDAYLYRQKDYERLTGEAERRAKSY